MIEMFKPKEIAKPLPNWVLPVCLGLASFGVNAVLTSIVLYLQNILHYSPKASFEMFSRWLSVFYIFPLLAGYLESRYLNSYYAVLLGLALMLVGQATCVIDRYILAGLVCFALGAAFVSTNIYIVCLVPLSVTTNP